MAFLVCGVDTPYDCTDCLTLELGGVRWVAFVRLCTTFDYASAAAWDAAITAGNAMLIPTTRGSYDGGVAVEGAGYGNRKVTFLGRDHSLTFFDPRAVQNCAFWNSMAYTTEFRMLWGTQTQVWDSVVPVTILPMNPIAEDITSVVETNVTAKWSHPDLICPTPAPAAPFGDRCSPLPC